MTDRRPKRHAAAASRVLVLGVATATTLGLVAGWTATARPTAPAPGPVVRALVTDSRIDPLAAAQAAAGAARSGRASVQVPVDAVGRPLAAAAADTTTSAS